MRKTGMLGISLVMLMTTGMSVDALAQELRRDPITGTRAPPTKAVPGKKGIPLSTNECWGLGGDVKPQSKCLTGKICVTQSKKGVYSQCITTVQ